MHMHMYDVYVQTLTPTLELLLELETIGRGGEIGGRKMEESIHQEDGRNEIFVPSFSNILHIPPLYIFAAEK